MAKVYAYMIESEKGFRYTGHTPDLERRLSEHNAGLSHSTKHGRNWRIIYTEEFDSRGDAMKRERYLKSSAGRRYVKTMLRGPKVRHSFWRGGVRPDEVRTE